LCSVWSEACLALARGKKVRKNFCSPRVAETWTLCLWVQCFCPDCVNLYQYGFPSFNKNNQISIHLAGLRFICEKSHHKQMLESSWIMKILNVDLQTLINTYRVDTYKFTGNTKALFIIFYYSRFLK